MYSLRDRTRRWICRTVFILAGVLPLVAVVGWSAVIQSAGHLARVRVDLAAALDCDVRLSAVSYPRPGVTLLEGVELADRSTGDTLATARMVEIVTGEHGPVLHLSQPVITAARVQRLWSLVETQLRRGADWNSQMLGVSAAELTLRWPAGEHTLLDCTAQVESHEGSVAATAEFRVPGAASIEPMQLRVQRTLGTGLPSLAIDLATGTAPLPCSLLAVLIGCDNRLGANSGWRGSAKAVQSPDGWQAEFSGRLENVDLQAAISEQFPHQLTGIGELTISRGLVHDGRLEECEGSLRAGPGVVSQSLLAAAADWLGMRRGSVASVAANGTVGYDQLTADFYLGAHGISIHGANLRGESGCVMNGRDGALLTESPGGKIPVVSLVKALVPDSRLQVPATRQTDWLLRLLPVPDVLPRDPQSPPQAKLRGPDQRITK